MNLLFIIFLLSSVSYSIAATTASNLLVSATTLLPSSTTPPATTTPRARTTPLATTTPPATTPPATTTPRASTTPLATTTQSSSTTTQAPSSATQPVLITILSSTTKKPADQPENILNSNIVNITVSSMSTTSTPLSTTIHDKPVSVSSELSTPPTTDITTLSANELPQSSKLVDMITSSEPLELANERPANDEASKDTKEVDSHVASSTTVPVNDASPSTLFVTVSEEPIVKLVASTVKPTHNQSFVLHQETTTPSISNQDEKEAKVAVLLKSNLSSSTPLPNNEIPIASLKKPEILFKDEDDMVIEDIGTHNDNDNLDTMSFFEELELKEKEKKAIKEAKDSENIDKVKSNDEEKKKSDTIVDPIVKLIVPSLQTTNQTADAASSSLVSTTASKDSAEEFEEFLDPAITPISSSSSSLSSLIANVFTTLSPLSFRSADLDTTVLAMTTTVDSVSLSSEEVPSTSSPNTLSTEAKKLSTPDSVSTTPQSELTATTSNLAVVTTTADSVSHSMPVQAQVEPEVKPVTSASPVDNSATDTVLNLFKEVPVKRTDNVKVLSDQKLESALNDLGSNLTELINASHLPSVDKKVVPVSEAGISEIQEVLEQFNNLLNQTSGQPKPHAKEPESSVDKIADTLTTPISSPITTSSLSFSNPSSDSMVSLVEESVTLSDQTLDSAVKVKIESDVNIQASEVVNNKDDKVIEEIAESSHKPTEPSELTEVVTSDVREAKDDMASSTEAATTVSPLEGTKESSQTESGLKFDGVNFVCHSDGIFNHPKDCTKFVFCSSGSPMLSVCPLGLGWNSKHSTCDLLKNSDCTSSVN